MNTTPDATERVLGDMEMFSDFLACRGERHVTSERITRYPALTMQRLKDADLPQVLHLLANGDAADCVSARDELVRRYLADNRKFIGRMAVNLAFDRVAA